MFSIEGGWSKYQRSILGSPSPTGYSLQHDAGQLKEEVCDSMTLDSECKYCVAGSSRRSSVAWKMVLLQMRMIYTNGMPQSGSLIDCRAQVYIISFSNSL
jgi:hypothetical protein